MPPTGRGVLRTERGCGHEPPTGRLPEARWERRGEWELSRGVLPHSAFGQSNTPRAASG